MEQNTAPQLSAITGSNNAMKKELAIPSWPQAADLPARSSHSTIQGSAGRRGCPGRRLARRNPVEHRSPIGTIPATRRVRWQRSNVGPRISVRNAEHRSAGDNSSTGPTCSQPLSYSLNLPPASKIPEDASIDQCTGVFLWTPTRGTRSRQYQSRFA